MARLRLLTPMPDIAQRFPLNGQMVRIGREIDNDIVLPNPTVSRYHATIHINQEGIRIEDRGSSNGIYHNGHKVEKAWLMPGDRLFIGKLEFRVEDEQMAPAAPETIATATIQIPQGNTPEALRNRRPILVAIIGAIIVALGLAYLMLTPEKKTPPKKPAKVGK